LALPSRYSKAVNGTIHPRFYRKGLSLSDNTLATGLSKFIHSPETSAGQRVVWLIVFIAGDFVPVSTVTADLLTQSCPVGTDTHMTLCSAVDHYCGILASAAVSLLVFEAPKFVCIFLLFLHFQLWVNLLLSHFLANKGFFIRLMMNMRRRYLYCCSGCSDPVLWIALCVAFLPLRPDVAKCIMPPTYRDQAAAAAN